MSVKTRMFPVKVAMSLVLLWCILLFSWHATMNVLKDFKIPFPTISLFAAWIMNSWAGWAGVVLPYLAAGIAVMLRWRSVGGWVWAFVLCLVCDIIACGLLALLLPLSYMLVTAPAAKPPMLPVLLGLTAGVLGGTQLLILALIIHRRAFFAR